jgi:Mg/Co/Ni transporter MgtE
MEYKDIGLDNALSIWWSLVWRATLVGMLVGAVLGAIGGFAMGISGRSDLAGAAGALMGWLGSIPVSVWALKAALSRRHGGYSVVLVELPQE